MVYASAGAAEGFDLSLGSLDSDSEPEKPEEDFAREDAVAAEKEFKRVLSNWFGLVVDWKAEFPEANLKDVDLLHDLIDIDLGRFYHKLITKADPDRSRFGFFPLMAGCCDGQIGALNAESFAERVVSCSNPVMTNGNTLLGLKMLEMTKASMKRMSSELIMAAAALGSIKKLAAEGAGLLGGAGAAYAFDRRQTFAAQQRKASEPVSQKGRRAG